MVCIVSTTLLWSKRMPCTSSMACLLKEIPPCSTPLEVETDCRAALFCSTSRRVLANSSGPTMFSQQTAEDGGNQKRWLQLTSFPGVSVTMGLSAGKLWSRCRRDDPEPHSQSSRTSPDCCSEGNAETPPAGPAPFAGKRTPNRRQQDRQSQALLSAPWRISNVAERWMNRVDQILTIEEVTDAQAAVTAGESLFFGTFSLTQLSLDVLHSCLSSA